MAKPVELGSDLVPIAQFRSRTAQLLDEMEEGGRTLVITQNGKAAAVVMSPRAFDALEQRRRLVEDIARGLADVEEGRVQSSEEVREALRQRRRDRR